MPNKFITNLDLARQAEIFSGETAVFQGGIQLGIPFSGFPSGVDTSTITSMGVVDTQFAAFSGGTGTTVFNVTDPTSIYYNATATTLSVSPYTVIDNDTITETVSATTYPTIMTFTALSGTSDAPLSISFTPSVIQEIYNRGLYGTLFDGLGLSSLGQTFIDESFYNDGSIFSGANLNMEIVDYAPHGTTPAWVTGTTSGTVIEYSALTQYWTDTTIINGVSGLTLPITPESAETKTIDYVWTLTDSTIIDENVIGLEYTGYSVTYSFNDVIVDPESPSAVGATGATSADTYYLGTVTASLENFSAGTLDYKESTNWISIDGNATVTERLTVDRMTIDNPGTGTPINNIGITVDGDVVFGTTGATVTGLTFNDTTYDLTVGLDNGLSFTDSLAILASDIKVTGGTYDGVTGEIDFVNNSGGTFVVSGLTTEFTGNTSGTCITDLHISNLHSCSPLYVNPLDEGNVYFGSTSGVTIDVANNRIGIGNNTPTEALEVSGKTIIYRDYVPNSLPDLSNDYSQFSVIRVSVSTGEPIHGLISAPLNTTGAFMLQNQRLGSGSDEALDLLLNPKGGNVGIGITGATEVLDISGNTKISGTINVGQNNTISTASTASSIVGGNDNTLNQLTDISAIVGGSGNTIGNLLFYDVIGAGIFAGIDNIVNRDSHYSVVIGGETNQVGDNSSSSAIIGGYSHLLDAQSSYSVISGGYDNNINNTTQSTIFGGSGNTLNDSTEAFIAGGSDNIITSSGKIRGNSIIGSKSASISGSTSDDYNFVAGSESVTIFEGTGNAIIASFVSDMEFFGAQGEYNAIIGGVNNYMGRSWTGGTYDVDISAIIGGDSNSINDGSDGSFIAGGGASNIYNGDYSGIVGGVTHKISASTVSFIGGGADIDINNSNLSVAVGGGDHFINDSEFSGLISGEKNKIQTNSDHSIIGGGSGNTIDNGSDRSGMLGGKGLLINSSEDSIIAGGFGNTLTQSNYSAIIGGTDNTLNAAGDDRSAIIAGSGNTITNGGNESNVIIAGIGNTLKAGDGSTIVGGLNNLIQFGNDSCSIVGGSNNLMNASNNSVIIGGQSITGTNSDTVYVPNLNIGGGITTSLLTLQSFDDDSAAGTGGLSAGEVYQTTGAGAAPLNVAGILMVKQ